MCPIINTLDLVLRGELTRVNYAAAHTYMYPDEEGLRILFWAPEVGGRQRGDARFSQEGKQLGKPHGVQNYCSQRENHSSLS